jgi:integrase
MWELVMKGTAPSDGIPHLCNKTGLLLLPCDAERVEGDAQRVAHDLCALRWAHVDLDAGVLTIRRSVAQSGTRTWEKDTKTHQRRRIILDQATLLCRRARLENLPAASR